MKKNIELAKVLMRDSWFSKDCFNNVMQRVDRWDTPCFEDVQRLLEKRKVIDSECELSLGLECQYNYNCNDCYHNKEYIRTEYHFPDSPSQEECEAQIEILKEFHLI